MLAVLGFALLLLVLEAWVSMIEVSFFSVPSLTLERLRHEAAARGQGRSATGTSDRVLKLERLLAQPTQFLGTILVADTLISVALSSDVALFAVLFARRFGQSEALVMTIAGVALVLALLVLGETVPKLLALRRPVRLALAFVPVVGVIHSLLRPVSLLLQRAAERILGGARTVPFPTEAELKTMIELGKERGVIVGGEEEILWNLIELNRRTVSEIMTPRIDFQALEKDTTVKRALELAREKRRSRLPVYDRTIDRIVGVFYIKDCFRLSDDSVPVGTVARDAYFIPEVKKVPALLEEFRRLGVHVAIVVDEFGQTAGLVTLEDVLEVIFGEIRDEHDATEELPYFRVDEHSYWVDGDVDLRTLNRLFRHAFKGQDFERLSGFIHHMLGRLPESGDRFRFKNLVIEVQQVRENQIERVIIRRTKPLMSADERRSSP
jgi:CBS domain containing-hemolysin-like protein